MYFLMCICVVFLHSLLKDYIQMKESNIKESKGMMHMGSDDHYLGERE